MNIEQRIQEGKKLLVKVFMSCTYTNPEGFSPKFITFDCSTNPLYVFDHRPEYSTDEWLVPRGVIHAGFRRMESVPPLLIDELSIIASPSLRHKMIVELEDWMISAQNL